MAINKKLIHFNSFDVFNTYRLSANSNDTQYTIGINGTITDGPPDIPWHSIVFIKDTKEIWTHGQYYGASSLANVEAVDPETSVGDVDDVAFNIITAEPTEQDSEELEDYVLMKSDVEHIIPYVVEQNNSEVTIQPNVLNRWGVVDSLDITLAEGKEGVVNEYMVQFTSGENTTLTLPNTIKWMAAPSIEAGVTYQLSIVNNLAIIGGFKDE